MEDTLEGPGGRDQARARHVLILVLMEDTLEEYTVVTVVKDTTYVS